jgi:sodium transport system permease protein
MREPRTALPSAGAAVGLVLFVGLLFFYGARLLGVRAGETGILISQWAFLAAPALLFVLVGRYEARATLALRAPPLRGVGAAVLIAAGGIPIGWFIVWLQGFVLEIPYEFLQAMQRMLTADTPGRVLWLLLVVAVTPAICEELVFRGVLLHGLRTRTTAARSILLSAAVFGAFHLSSESALRFLPTLWLGLLLGLVVWRTRSLFAGMLMHFLNNGVVVLLLAAPGLGELLGLGGTQPPWLFVAIAPLLLLAGVRLLPRREAEPID